MKACKAIDKLTKLRKSQGKDYDIISAPFYYLYGSSLFNYIAEKTTEMGHLDKLEFSEDEEED